MKIYAIKVECSCYGDTFIELAMVDAESEDDARKKWCECMEDDEGGICATSYDGAYGTPNQNTITFRRAVEITKAESEVLDKLSVLYIS